MGISAKYHDHFSLLAQDDQDNEETHEIERLQRLVKRLKILSAFLVASLLISNFAIAFFTSQPSTSRNHDTRPRIPITFEENHNFSGPSNATTDAAWGSITPPGDGFITINNATRDVSMYHQLHCLRHIRTYLWTLKFSIKYNTTEQVMGSMDPKQEHIGHCFDYLRQGILCAGDLTLETPRESDGGVDGWGTVHMCVDPGVVEGFMEEHRMEVWQ